jgi:putative glutamine amidotransferase
MSPNTPSVRIGIFGSDQSDLTPARGKNLWAPGYAAVVTAANGLPVPLQARPKWSWSEILEQVDAVVFANTRATSPQELANEQQFCESCRELRLPFLGVDHGLHVLNLTYGGTLHYDLPRELPLALQHRHRPEPGVRHAIAVSDDTHLSAIYGEGEIIVNSEHTVAVNTVAKGFRVSARALDGVVEAIESEADDWFALGVQWHPASASASGLDIQLFRGLIEAVARRAQPAPRTVAA